MARSTVDSPSNDKLSRMLRVTNSFKEINQYDMLKTFETYGAIKKISKEDVQQKSTFQTTWSVIITFEKSKYMKLAYADKKDISCQGIKLELFKVDSIPNFVLETSDDPDSDSPKTIPPSPLYPPSVPHPTPVPSIPKTPKDEPTRKKVNNKHRTTPNLYDKGYTLQLEGRVILEAFKNSQLGFYKSYPLSFIVLFRYLYRQRPWTNQWANNFIKNANDFVKEQTLRLRDLEKPGLEQLLYWSTVLFHTLCYTDCNLKLPSSASKRGNQLVNEVQVKCARDTREHIAKSLEDCVKSILKIVFSQIGSIFNGYFSGKRSESLSENVYDNFCSFWSFLEDVSKQARLPQPILDLIMAGAHNTFRVFGYNQFLKHTSKSCSKDEAEMFVKLCDLLQNRWDVPVQKNQDKMRENDQKRETEKVDLLTLVTPSFLLRDAAKYVVKVWKYMEKNRGRRLLDEIDDLQETLNDLPSNSAAKSDLSPAAMRLIAKNCSEIAILNNQESTDKISLWKDLQRGIDLSEEEEEIICNKEMLDKKHLLVSNYLNSCVKKHRFELSIIQETELKIPMPWMYSDEKDVAHELLEELGFK